MKITIKGHPTRGKEVIQILENLGGRNISNHKGNDNYAYYISNIDNRIYKTSLLFSEYQHYTLEEFEKEFPFKIGDKIRDCSDNEVGIITDLLFIDNMLMYNVDFVNSGQAFMSTEQLKFHKEMKEKRNISLTIDKAKEWYKKGGELKEIALQAFSEKELNPLPRSWEEFCERYPVQKGESWMGSFDTIYCATNIQDRIYKNWIPSKKSAEAHVAMVQLEQLRDCWWGDWKPEWSNSEKYVIKWEGDNLIVFTARRVHAFLVFPTREMAEEFLKCFMDLIEQAGDLI